ncbi:MAG: hypothetical protein WAQ05_03000, partial [Rubrivivax sp.]
HAAAEQWLAARRARQLQVVTLSDSHPSPEYAQTRAFYTAVGYAPSDTAPVSGAEHLPVLQLVKRLA